MDAVSNIESARLYTDMPDRFEVQAMTTPPRKPRRKAEQRAESLEQLRALWFGCRIQVADACEAPPAGVDTQLDLDRVRALLGAS